MEEKNVKKYKGLLIASIFLLVILGGCSAWIESDSTSDQKNESIESNSEVVQSKDGEEEVDYPFAYTDARGKKVVIEKKPERIAVATWMITEKLLAIATPPIAADTMQTMSTWASMKDYLEEYQIEDLGTEVNLERLLELKPDLILATEANANIYEKLEAIAPVVVFDVNVMFGDWQTSTREVAKVVGESKNAETFINDLIQQIENGKKELSTDGKTVGFLRLWSNSIYSMGIESCSAYYGDENGLGLNIPKDWPKEIGAISLEALTQMNPDYIFISSIEDEAYMKELETNEVWNSLTAVKENQVYTIDLSALSGGALASKYGVEVILEALTGSN